MRIALSQQHEAWRAEIREFLDAELPEENAFNPEFDDAPPDQWAIAVEFSKKVAAKGWIGLTWPKEYGGKGLAPIANQILLEELYAADAPMINSVGIFLAAGTILVGGTEEQKKRLLPDIANMRTCGPKVSPNRRQVPTSAPCGRRPSGTATNGSSPERRPSRRGARCPTSCTWPPARRPTTPRVMRSASSWSICAVQVSLSTRCATTAVACSRAHTWTRCVCRRTR